jgi:hypothetical protein
LPAIHDRERSTVAVPDQVRSSLVKPGMTAIVFFLS